MMRSRLRSIGTIAFLLLASSVAKTQGMSKAWVSDQGNGMYKNPVLHADYSDPDAVRVGDDYYLTASSFEEAPGLPILHSKDLVNWTLIGHALRRQVPAAHFAASRHGEGVWAPSLRFHKGEFFLYYPDPDFGIYLVKAKKAAGPWSEPVLVAPGKGLIDPCPLWDQDGQAYLVHAFAGSRAGIKSIIVVKKMNAEGTQVLDDGVLVYDGHELDPTIEGPKFYQRNGYYYIFAPAGGVATGWQTVLRSRNIYGPYERRVVMEQGRSSVNGPHQGAWVQTQTGEDWFLHFQDKEAYGRILHLQPMKWVDNWPVIGADADGDGKGEPVLVYKKPNVGRSWPRATPAESDEFNGPPGLQWQWKANPSATWSFADLSKGVLRLFSHRLPDSVSNLWDAPNVLVQKFPAEEFTVTTKISFTANPKLEGERAGLIISGLKYATLFIRKAGNGYEVVYAECSDADRGGKEVEKKSLSLSAGTVHFRVQVGKGGQCRLSCSADGLQFTEMGQFTASVGKWIGARMGLYCVRRSQTNDAGWADVDWWRVSR